ncbi:MAG: serine/threonine-protein kinase [Myxococcota bacterium]
MKRPILHCREKQRLSESANVRADDALLTQRLRLYAGFFGLMPSVATLIRNLYRTFAGASGSAVWSSAENLPNALGLLAVVLVLLILRFTTLNGRILRGLEVALTCSLLTIFISKSAFTEGPLGASGAFGMLASMLILFVRALFLPSPAWLSGVLGALATLGVIAQGLLTPSGIFLGADGALHWALWGFATTTATVIASASLGSLRRGSRAAEALGAYRLGDKLGEGGMGSVYAATHELLKLPAAVKILRSSDPTFLERFYKEARATAELTHPNTVRIYDFGRTNDDAPYYVMERVRGIDLQRYVERHGPLSEARAVHIIRQAAGALAEAHSIGLIHRDIKPSNLMLVDLRGSEADVGNEKDARRSNYETDFVKVLDFGLVRALGESKVAIDVTQETVTSGTPLYMAPEQAIAPDQVGVAADIYALACVLVFITTGRTLVRGESAVEVLSEHIHLDKADLLRREANALTPSLRTTLAEALAKRPEERWESMATFSMALGSLTALATTPHPSPETTSPALASQDSVERPAQITVNLGER